MSWRAAFPKRWADWPFLAAVGISLFTAALRIAPLRESLWLDELHTAWCAVGPLDEVARRAALGNQGPLFFWLEWLLVGLLGPSELSLRLPSFLAGSLLPLAVFLFSRRLGTATMGLVAAALVAVDPLGIFYSTEARPYALVQLLAVIQIAITAEMIHRPTARIRCGWIASAATLFYLHYTTALVFAAEIVFYALVVLLQPKWAAYRWKSAAFDCVCLAAICLPAAGNLRAIFARRTNWEFFVEQKPLLEALDWWPYPPVVSGGLLAVAVIRLLWLVVASRSVVSEEMDRAAVAGQDRVVVSTLLVCWVVIPLLVAWLTTQTNIARLLFPRYLAAILPGVAILAAFLATSLRPTWLRPLAGLVLIALATWPAVEQARENGRVIAPRNEDWRGCVAWLNERLPDSGFPVLVFSGLIEADELRQPHDELLEDYCLAPVNSLYPLDIDRGDIFPLALHDPGKLDQVAEMLVVHRGGAWLVVRGDKKRAAQIAEEIVTHLRRAAIAETGVNWRVKESQSFGRVQVLLLAADTAEQIEPPDPSVAGP